MVRSFGLVSWLLLFGSMALRLRTTYRSKHKAWVAYSKMLRVQMAMATFRGGEVPSTDPLQLVDVIS